MSKVSIVVPSRNEKLLQPTISDLLAKATGEIEIFAVLDGGPWPDPPLTEDPRLIVVRHPEPLGMRQSLNEVSKIATGKYLMKVDAHCIFSEGYDEVLQASCEEDWIAVPTRHSLDANVWMEQYALGDDGDVDLAVRHRHFNYHALTYPYRATEYGAGFHGVTFSQQENRRINEETKDVRVDDLLSFQGSCWFQHLSNFNRLGPLDHEKFDFYQESQCVGLRTWLTGGRCVIVKDTHYCHAHKGKENKGADGRKGRGFYLSLVKMRLSEDRMVEQCLNNRWPNQTRTFDSLIEQFWPLLKRLDGSRTWPSDWRDWEKHRLVFEARTPEQIPAHT